jgi:hypothetical protein
MTWFGAPWGSRINRGEHQETPTGEPCLHCSEPIEWWASGVVMAVGERRRPLHLECFLRSTVGSLGHLRGRCSCYGGDEEDPPGVSVRDAARAAARFLVSG